ncbi:MAG: alpha/beta fold hydrolase, partial [Paracoccaceae bacterium]|nr:alpha/beta fold hydrolase [Paracoccaceae bacterium]
DLEMAFMDLQPEGEAKGTVVLLHGKNFSGAYWEETAKALSAVGYRVLMPDQIGFGKSSKPEHYQFSFAQLATNTNALLRNLGIEKAFVPYIMPEMRPTDTTGWIAFGKRLAEAGKPLRDAGIPFGWHNHAFEFDATETGEMPLDLIAAASDDLLLELDLGWVRVAGHDPVAWIKKYAGRISTVHVKDIAPDGQCTDEDGWADVGHGIMEWPAIHAALQAAGVDHYVVEHDNPKDDRRFATRSLAAIQNF